MKNVTSECHIFVCCLSVRILSWQQRVPVLVSASLLTRVRSSELRFEMGFQGEATAAAAAWGITCEDLCSFSVGQILLSRKIQTN